MSDTGAGTGGQELYERIAGLVAGFVDDRLAEFRHEVNETLVEVLGGYGDAIARDRTEISHLKATVGGLRDAVGRLQDGESMPEHVYKNFIRSEAERLKIVKRRAPSDSPSSTPTPDNVT